MQTALIRTMLRLTLTAVMMMAVTLAPGGTSPHHDPVALAGAQSLAELVTERQPHGHVHEEIEPPAGGIAGAHEHDAADHTHDTSVLPGGVAAPLAELQPRWSGFPRSGPSDGPPTRLDRPPRGSTAT